VFCEGGKRLVKVSDREILQWDVANWRVVLQLWDETAVCRDDAQVLDLGARDGGLSLYFASKGCRVVCSDLNGPSPVAKVLHERYGVGHLVKYEAIDATNIAYPEASFDIVCFKSVLGGIGGAGGYTAQEKAVREMHRVLRPGGKLLFAENLVGTRLHAFLRKRFVAWGERWRYLSLGEVHDLLRPFSEVTRVCTGLLATFGRREWQRSLLHFVDVLVDPITPDAWKYIVAGCAVK